jgi:hypothetical protein
MAAYMAELEYTFFGVSSSFLHLSSMSRKMKTEHWITFGCTLW